MSGCASMAGAGGPAVLKPLEKSENKRQSGGRGSGARMVFPRLQGAAAVVSAALWGFGAPAVAQSVSAKGDTPVRAAERQVVAASIKLDLTQQAEALARSSTAEDTLRRIDAVLQCRKAIDINVNAQLAVDALALALR